MGFGSGIYKKTADILFQRRLSAEKRAERERGRIFEELPEAAELDRKISDTGIQAARAVLRGGDVAEEMRKLRDSNLSAQNQLKNLLRANGYSENALEPQYSCSKCSDKGFYEDGGRTVVCECQKRLLVQTACEELNRSAPLALSTFDSFDLSYYDKTFDSALKTSPFAIMEKIFKFCRAYAQGFTPGSASILMRGKTGLGKTHLSLAIANEVIRRGYGVVYVSAPNLLSKLEKQHFSRSSDEESLVDLLIDCDLLIIDDLGTEFQTQFSAAQFYNIFNSRVLQHKPLIINTNLTLRELEKSYSERFVSRIIGNAEKLDFIGSDVRIRKQRQQ